MTECYAIHQGSIIDVVFPTHMEWVSKEWDRMQPLSDFGNYSPTDLVAKRNPLFVVQPFGGLVLMQKKQNKTCIHAKFTLLTLILNLGYDCFISY